MIFATTIALMVSFVIAAEIIQRSDPDCDYILLIRIGKKFEINNPGFPALYREDMMCRWIINCPEQYYCRLRCRDVALPQSDECERDKLLVSPIGSLELKGAEVYCGRMVIDTKSVNQRITMGLITSRKSRGGRFRCMAYAEPVM